MDEAEILEALEARGAVLRGHFRLSSGRHSDVFVQKFRVFEDPLLTRKLGEQMAQLYEDDPFDTVASPRSERSSSASRLRSQEQRGWSSRSARVTR